VRLDPQFALAWAWLANANFYLPEHNDVPNWKSYLEAGKKAANHAYKLDPNLSDANFALGYARLIDLDLPGQWDARRRAHDLDEAWVAAMHEFGMAYALMGLFEKSYPYIEKSIADDPFSPSFTGALGIYQWILGNHAAASASFDRTIELGWLLVGISKAQMIAASGKRDEAYAFLMKAFKDHAKEVPPQFRSRIVQWLFSLAVTKETGWARALIWRSIKRDVGNPKKMSSLAFSHTLITGRGGSLFQRGPRPAEHLSLRCADEPLDPDRDRAKSPHPSRLSEIRRRHRPRALLAASRLASSGPAKTGHGWFKPSILFAGDAPFDPSPGAAPAQGANDARCELCKFVIH
jgi:tetratricopeptide (TPR) repeat protein